MCTLTHNRDAMRSTLTAVEPVAQEHLAQGHHIDIAQEHHIDCHRTCRIRASFPPRLGCRIPRRCATMTLRTPAYARRYTHLTRTCYRTYCTPRHYTQAPCHIRVPCIHTARMHMRENTAQRTPHRRRQPSRPRRRLSGRSRERILPSSN